MEYQYRVDWNGVNKYFSPEFQKWVEKGAGVGDKMMVMS